MIHLPAGISAVEMQDPHISSAVIDAHGAHVAYCPNEDHAAEIARALNAQMAPPAKPKTKSKNASWMDAELVLWGSHPAHCNGAWLKLSADLSAKNQERRRKEGWTLEIRAKGNKPPEIAQERKLNPFDPGAPTPPPQPVEIAKGFNPHGLTARQVGKGWHLLDEREPIQSGDGFFDPQMGMFLSYECRPDLFRGYNYGALGSQEPREYVHTWAWRRKDEPKKSA